MRRVAVLVGVLSLVCPWAAAARLVAWGLNSHGQCDVPDGNDFAAVVATVYSSIALQRDGSIVAWGSAEYDLTTPPDDGPFTTLAAGTNHALALRADGSLTAWGDNSAGQCDVPAGGDFIAIGGGYYHSVALRADGAVRCWGSNAYGQCDAPDANDFVAVAAGAFHTLAIRRDGTLAAWGRNDSGQCDVPAGAGFVQVAAGNAHSLALHGDGTLRAWGRDMYGLISGLPGGDDYLRIGAAAQLNVALTRSGLPVAWGQNNYGQADPPPDASLIAVATGGYHGLGLEVEAQTVRLFEPNGGERLYAGRTAPILWEAPLVLGRILLEFSTDDGQFWQVIATAEPVGRFDWRVPAVNSDRCRIRVSPVDLPDIHDQSDAVFTIATGGLELLTPAVGQVLVAGRTYPVTWNTIGTVTEVTLEYQPVGQVDWIPIETLANTGGYDWQVPVGPAGPARLRVRDAAWPEVFDVSDGPFMLLAPQADTLIVDAAGAGDYGRIQEAIDIAADGATVLVLPGTYAESLRFNSRAITVCSVAPTDPNYIVGTILVSENEPCVVFDFRETPASVLMGLTLESNADAAIRCYQADPTLAHNIIRCAPGSGIVGVAGAAPAITDNVIEVCGQAGVVGCAGLIRDNVVQDNGVGLWACDGTLRQNVIRRAEIYGVYDCDGIIEQNAILDNGQGGLFQCDGSITGNLIAGNPVALDACDGHIHANTIRDNEQGLVDCRATIEGNVFIAQAGAILSDCVGPIQDNLAEDNAGGLVSCDGTIRGNVVRRTAGTAIEQCRGWITNNILSGSADAAIADCNAVVAFNTLVGNGTAVRGSLGPVTGNIFAWNDVAVSGPVESRYNAFWANRRHFAAGAFAGPGDVMADPLFATDGDWLDAGTPEDPSDDVWQDGDYHLRSEAGRWDPNAQDWPVDDVTSPCIDNADPTEPVGSEPNPNGGRANMGAYGTTAWASKSTGQPGPQPAPRCVDRPSMDFTGDCRVDLADFALFAEEWLTCGFDLPEACGASSTR